MDKVEVTHPDQDAAAALIDSLGGTRRFEDAGISFAALDRITTHAFARHRIAGMEAAALIIDANVPVTTGSGSYMVPRRDGNAYGLEYAAAIRAQITESEQPTPQQSSPAPTD